jgi:thiamine pyrophosphokinase
MRTVIFANGILNCPPKLDTILESTDLIIAADGGLHHCLKLKHSPNVLIGDLDSVGDHRRMLNTKEIECLPYPEDKDETDLELALQLAKKRGSTEILLLGALGARWDMTLANVLALADEKLTGITVRILDGRQELILLRGPTEHTFLGKKGDILSLLPFGRDVNGIALTGLRYTLDNETLHFGTARGASNVFIAEKAIVKIRHGLLLCVLTREESG